MPPYATQIKLRRHDSLKDTMCPEKSSVLTTALGEDVTVPVVKGDLTTLPVNVQQFIACNVALCQPTAVYLCDGSDEEAQQIADKLVTRGTLIKLAKYENSYLCRTDPADVARVESKTFIVTEKKYDSIPHVKDGVDGILGKWMSPEDMEVQLAARFPGCMKGRTMYVIPFSMGPIGSPLSKVGVELTDSNYVVLSMRIMTRVTSGVWDLIHAGREFVECVHSMGAPRPMKRPLVNHWPCDPERVLIGHFPAKRLIMSYGSGYGGNSLLGKKCFALRIASTLARDEGWLAEHMLIMGVTDPSGRERFVAAAFPSACGKTNMAMMTPTLPGWKVRCIGDDIAWMHFYDGRLRAINPEAGFFGVAPGTNHKTNPVAMNTIFKNTIFTNVALTEDGGVFWEGMEKEVDKNLSIRTWLDEAWTIGDATKAAHPNSRFCTPAGQCPSIHPDWESPEGVPIDAILWGGRRPVGVPLVVEARSWQHGVMMGAGLKSEATAAAEFAGSKIMHDPMAMRPFFGYNFGNYLQHWLDIGDVPGRHLPALVHVNWFRLDAEGRFLWPGFGDNIRVLDWVFRRIDGEDVAVETPIGLIPKKGSMNLEGLGELNWDELMSLPKDYWTEDSLEMMGFLDDQVGQDLPEAIRSEFLSQQERIANM